MRYFEFQQPVFIHNYLEGPKWLPGVVCGIIGPLFNKVQTIDGHLWKRHVDHIRSREWNEYSDQPPMVSPTETVGQERWS